MTSIRAGERESMRVQGLPSLRVTGRTSLRSRAMTWMRTNSLRAVPQFQRGLSEAALRDVTNGACAPLIDACRKAGLDLRIRDNYLTAYAAGRAVALFKWSDGVASLELHHRFLREGALEGLTRCRRKDYWAYPVTPELAARFAEETAHLVANAQAQAGVEKRHENALLSANSSDCELVCLDRQLQMPTRSGRVDLVAVTRHGDRALALVEVRGQQDSALQHTPAQLLHYVETFAPSLESGLREDVAQSLSRVAAQLRQLGCAAPDPRRILPGMPVVGLVVVMSDKPDAQFLTPVRTAAAALARPIYLWTPPSGAAPVIPPIGTWQALR